MSLNISDSLQVTELNRPTRVGELIRSIAQMREIPNPRVGMMVYVKDEGKNYIVRSLKEKVINGVTVQNAQVDKYELFEGGGGTGEIADGSVTERKLSTDVVGKLNTAYDKANLADSLFINDGITFIQGSLDGETGDIYKGTPYCATSLPIYSGGEKITVNSGYNITKYVLYYDGKADGYGDVNMTDFDSFELAGTKNAFIRIEVCRTDNNAISSKEYPNIVKSFIRKPIAWSETCNINNFVCAGRYTISGSRKVNATDNMPIYNGGNIEARLEVLENENTLVQILTLLNVGGGDGNIYTRTRQNDSWGAWGKLQTNIEVGRVEGDNAFDNFIDNGIYSGVYAYGSTAETFVLVVINAYLYGGGVAQLKYSTLLDGATTVQIRNRVNNVWGEWKNLGGTDYTLPVATTTTLGGVKSYENKGIVTDFPGGKDYAVNVDKNGFASVTILINEEIDVDSFDPVSGKAVADYVEDAVETPVVNHTETTVQIAPNVLNLWGEVAELNITFVEGKAGVINEYMFQFTSGATLTTLSLSSDIQWVSAPNIQANKTYQVSIINNLGIIGEFGNE